VHCDGARLLNAAVALGCKPAALTEPLDSTTLCLSKGLGAPVGSLLAGETAFVREARRARKAFGGGMRQAGVLAAAGLLALRDGPALLAVDHARAKRLAAGIAAHAWACVDTAAVETNIVMVDLPADRAGAEPARVLAHLQAAGVLAATAGPRRLRFVLHRDVDDAAVQRCLDACATFPHGATAPLSSPS
jgi:threonine aldolase